MGTKRMAIGELTQPVNAAMLVKNNGLIAERFNVQTIVVLQKE